MFIFPLRSFDMRSDLKGRHWMDRRVFGDRASFVVEKVDKFMKMFVAFSHPKLVTPRTQLPFLISPK